MDKNSIDIIPSRIGWYIAGFVDGEGSFNVSIKRSKEHRINWRVEPSFNISQKERAILALIKKWLRCGTLRERKDGLIYYEVRNLTSLNNIIIPFFNKFNFLSSTKKRNFMIFKKIMEKINKGEHLNQEGFTEIMKLRERLNQGHGRKRKYTLDNVIK